MLGGSGPRSAPDLIIISPSQFPAGEFPLGMDFWPPDALSSNTTLLFTTTAGRILRYDFSAATGAVKWSKPGFGPGGCTLVDGHVLVLSDAGDLVLVKATPEAYTEVTRSHVLAGKCWNYASVSNGRIYARSTKEGVCLDVMPQMTER